MKYQDDGSALMLYRCAVISLLIWLVVVASDVKRFASEAAHHASAAHDEAVAAKDAAEAAKDSADTAAEHADGAEQAAQLASDDVEEVAGLVQACMRR